MHAHRRSTPHISYNQASYQSHLVVQPAAICLRKTCRVAVCIPLKALYFHENNLQGVEKWPIISKVSIQIKAALHV